MPPTATHDADLDQVVELNRLFLRLLQTRAEEGKPCLGLERAVARRLGVVPPERLDALAELPRALFRLNLDPSRRPGSVSPDRRAALDSATQSLQLTVLLTAWNFSRRSTYAARLFLGLNSAQVAALRMQPLSDLPQLAATDGLVGCAFERTAWLWQELLSAAHPEQRRRLLLVALQPQTLVAADGARRAVGG